MTMILLCIFCNLRIHSFDYEAAFEDAEKTAFNEEKISREKKFGYFKRPLDQRLQRPTPTAQ